MKWVVLAIIAGLALYTALTLEYRKTGHVYEPYHDMKARANVMRLLDAGYRRVAIDASRPADAVRVSASAAVFPAPAGLPDALDQPLVEKPILPLDYTRVHAAESVAADSAYVIEVACALPDHKEQLSGAYLYVRGGELILAPEFERLRGELLARTDDTTALLTIPAGTLKPGRYHVLLAGQRASRAWSLQVH
ncbi:hypothetical protein K0B96_06180 [Horticoccus luteus]|uniref:Uncharacterized protein n=1 Tax=Horticoccus luteus TaxID=2862869 RepID=A0A8F9XIA1_9BACT|nr:hypothetical protein [Horticoccus luteus]QYM80200.1 hypothetical protein K0B96_06180 [Horticoccus luteus]